MKKKKGILLGAGLLVVIAMAGVAVYMWLSEGNVTRVEQGGGAAGVAGTGNGGGVVWAEAMERAGLPNLHRVSGTLYRGAQPEEAGFEELRKMGVKTVINLRSFHSDKEMMGDLPLGYESIEMKAWHPKDEDVARFLRLVTDEGNWPVFVHCQHGADRTGVCCAAYRIVVEGWSKEDAIKEMTEGGFGFHAVWGDLVDYVREMDVEKMRERMGKATAAH